MKRHKPDQLSTIEPTSPPDNTSTLAITLRTDANAGEASETSQHLAKRIVEIPTSDTEITDVNALADAPQLATADAIDLLIKESKHMASKVHQRITDTLIRDSKGKANCGNSTPALSVNKRVSWHQPTHQTTAYICESTLPIGGARKATGDVAHEKEAATGLPIAPPPGIPIAPPPSISSHDNDDSTR